MSYGKGAGGDILVKKLAGPGVEGLEHDPPVFHFDVKTDLMPELLADPVEFLKQLGLGPEQGVAPKGLMTVRLTGAEWIWNGRQWVATEDQTLASGDAGVSSSCCYISGPAEMTCHTHVIIE
ncbi:MAG: hypothetical protein M3143_05220 [Actinomycetota bacterium]|nr:hypothetical protein [Actinomycetota bacterium]